MIFSFGSESKLIAEILLIIFFNYNLQMKKHVEEIESDNPETFPWVNQTLVMTFDYSYVS